MKNTSLLLTAIFCTTITVFVLSKSWIPYQATPSSTPPSLPTSPSPPPNALQSIAVTPSPASAVTGDATLQMRATGIYSSGGSQNITSTVIWASSTPAIATISASGVVTPLAAGSTTITASNGSINGSSLLTINPSGSFTTLFSTDFETGGDHCTLKTVANGGQWYVVNGANTPSDTRSIDLSGHPGKAYSGFCSALDPSRLSTLPDNWGQLVATLSQRVNEVWVSGRVYFSDTWQHNNGNNGAMHMWRIGNEDCGGGCYGFEIGQENGNDTIELAEGCGNATNPYCQAGGNVEVNPQTSWSIVANKGAWHCWEWHVKSNSGPGTHDGLEDFFVDGVQYAHHAGFNMTGSLAPIGFPHVNFGSNVGGNAAGFPFDTNWWYLDNAQVTTGRSGCSLR
jgi:hypothetical protein